MGEQMKAIRVGPGRAVELLSVSVPIPGPGEALLRIEAVTTCPQWDLHLRHDEPMFVGHRFVHPYPVGQPGHEATGTIAAVGEGVTTLQVGQRASAWKDAGHGRDGCYAQYVVHQAEHLISVPETLPWEATAPLELAMCVGAAFLRLREMGAVAGRRIGVMGLGPAGLIAVQMARAEGAREVIAFDPLAQRREYALRLRPDQVLDPGTVEESQFPVRPLRPALETVVDCVGLKASVEWAMDRASDTVQLFGVQREAYEFAVRHYTLRLTGYPGHSREAAEYAVTLIQGGLLDLTPLVTHQLPLERYAEGIDLLEQRAAIKICFRPWWEG
ncbi:MAG: hypothetical protein FJX77_04505 [Armatimonadetes bacterium]|nr:hypothetical protein [Armatimonadota bacterium]